MNNKQEDNKMDITSHEQFRKLNASEIKDIQPVRFSNMPISEVKKFTPQDHALLTQEQIAAFPSIPWGDLPLPNKIALAVFYGFIAALGLIMLRFIYWVTPFDMTELTKDEVMPKHAEWNYKWHSGGDSIKFDLVIEKRKSDANDKCLQTAKKAAYFPTTVDWDFLGFGSTSKFKGGANKRNQGLYAYSHSGESKNGFGALLPFSVHCNFAVDITSAKLHLTSAYYKKAGTSSLIYQNNKIPNHSPFGPPIVTKKQIQAYKRSERIAEECSFLNFVFSPGVLNPFACWW